VQPVVPTNHPTASTVVGTLTLSDPPLTSAPPQVVAAVSHSTKTGTARSKPPAVISGLLDVTSGLGTDSLTGSTRLSIPFFFGLLALIIVAVQMHVGKQDPKLMEAPVLPDDRSVAFE
jgi:hypothetical protein